MAGPWRIIIDGALSGIENMARDAAVLELAETAASPQTTLRFYQWDVPTLSLGNKQDVARAADAAFCCANGVAIVRRPTGGGAVLHHLELTYSVVSNDRDYFPVQRILDIYLCISRALCRGLQLLGAPAAIQNHGSLAPTRTDNYIHNPYPCFSSASHYEIIVGERKIIGSAQKRLRAAFLQHGSIPYAYDWRLQAGAMGVEAAPLQAVMASIGDFVTPTPPYADLAGAFARGFAEEFRLADAAPRGAFTPAELERARALAGQFAVPSE